jgi:hypothetical protein
MSWEQNGNPFGQHYFPSIQSKLTDKHQNLRNIYYSGFGFTSLNAFNSAFRI